MAIQTEAPPAEADPLDALDNLKNPYLNGEVDDVVLTGDDASPPPRDTVPHTEPLPASLQEEMGGQFTKEEDKEVSDALSNALGIASDPASKLDGAPGDPKPARSNNLRGQLKDRNTTIDELTADLEVRRGEYEALEVKLQEADNERLQAQESLTNRYEVSSYDESTDPGVAKVDQELRATLQAAKMHLPAEQGQLLENQMVPLIKAYQQGIATGDGTRLHAFVDENFEGNRQEALRAIADMNKHIEQRTQLIADNRTTHFKTVIGGYENKLNTVKDQVSNIGTLSMEESLKDPTDLNSLISVATAQNPAFKKEVSRIQAQCANITAGVRPFDIRDAKWAPYVDPNDTTKLSQQGEEVRRKEVFMHESNQRNLPRALCLVSAAAALLPQLAQRLAKYESRVKDEQGEPELHVTDEAAPKGSPGAIDFTKIDPDDVDNPYV